MTISWGKNERRLYWRNPLWRVGRKDWDFGEGKCLLFHPLFPGETLNSFTGDVSLGIDYKDADAYGPVEYQFGMWIIKAGDSSIQNAIRLETGDHELRSASDSQGSNDLMASSEATDDNGMLDDYVKQLLLQASYYDGDDYQDEIQDFRGADNADQSALWNPDSLESQHKQIYKRAGWFRSEGDGSDIGSYGQPSRTNLHSMKVKVSKPRRIYEPSFLVAGAYLPKVRVESKWGWYWMQPHPTGYLEQYLRGMNTNLWNPEVIETIINDGVAGTFDENQATGENFAWYMAKMLRGDNFIEAGTFPSEQDAGKSGHAYLRGRAGIRTPINSMTLRPGNHWVS
jgi:hypothetical protein